ncbi:glutamic-oxaloacetic transaminase 1, soluble (aspartate aminotransferase 1) [Reticulomyxa filosa]|uniref:Glutamic-oxaloacetic transaminase 1, soluble (Aspartate aminotransferase 1) n=1 Tax=Reticulomyxa filosa TaxID=46433 RepID=X6NBE5_RETFI|nr:glutamic-oxaloacetic transaminase 1, soluble (aspartate aminotransferase 1) [Reticulomyxa filosa]|eukprot:ETO22642.1 glutamic-oxaloacetic transaminase 1, soluble (aspartate aminotransferase 1) [Reticulomyxa filosa]
MRFFFFLWCTYACYFLFLSRSVFSGKDKKIQNKICNSIWAKVEELPPDAIFLTKTLFTKDPSPSKVNLGIGAYRTEEGNPYILKVVQKVEHEIINDKTLDKEYAPICGDPQYVQLCQSVILGKNSLALKEKRVNLEQKKKKEIEGFFCWRFLSYVPFFFPKKNRPQVRNHCLEQVHCVCCANSLNKPTWGNHTKILAKARIEEGSYRYWNAKGRNLDIEGMLEDLNKANTGDVILLHACAHNPTGTDPTPEQWKKIANVMKKKKLIPFFDIAYQGFATGDLDRDAVSHKKTFESAIRLFEKEGFEFVVAQSFAKNMGLYSERAGCVTVVCNDKAYANACQSQLEAVIRPMYSNPPRYGAEIVKRVIGSAENFGLWQQEMTYMSGRIIKMRQLLRQHLEKLGTPGTWNHITDQIGMFSFTGLTGLVVSAL